MAAPSETEAARLRDAVGRLLERFARHTPALVMLDDSQWTDASLTAVSRSRLLFHRLEAEMPPPKPEAPMTRTVPATWGWGPALFTGVRHPWTTGPGVKATAISLLTGVGLWARGGIIGTAL